MFFEPFQSAFFIKAEKTPAPYSTYAPAPMFRREFTVDSFKEARLSLLPLGIGVFYLNGVPVTEDIFLCSANNYTDHLWYHVYDVTKLLRRGKNTIAVMMGNGFFNEALPLPWNFDKAPFRDAPSFLLSLSVDGITLLVSDSNFKCNLSDSPIVFNHLRSGEYYDARKKDDAWMQNGFDDSTWSSVIPKTDPPAKKLLAYPCQPIREFESISPKSIKKTDIGYLVDFGTVLSGYAEVILQAPRGREIILTYSERIDAQKRPFQEENIPRCYRDVPYHICKLYASGGKDTFHPRFSYFGFRYLEIVGLDEAPHIEDIRAIFIHQDVARTGSFSTGDPVLTYVYNAGIRSVYSNLFYSLTDCPGREKLGWTNDAQATVEQTLIHFDMLPVYKRWYEDIKSALREDGMMTGIVPSSGWGTKYGPVCDGLLFELPYRVYLYTKDATMLTGAIDVFHRYLEGFNEHVESGAWILGDWLGYGNSERTPVPFIMDFYRVRFLRITLLAERLAGHDASKTEVLLEKYESAFRNSYLRADGGCIYEEQTPLSILIAGELGGDRAVLCAQLISAVLRDGCTLTSGMVGIQYLFDALSIAGRADLACDLITESRPGYRTWYELGADTLWERWDGEHSGSRNHHMFSGVLSFFHKGLLGIKPDAAFPGFERLTLTPSFVRRLSFCRAEQRTVRGTLTAEWHAKNGGFVYTVNLPAGIAASYGKYTLSVGENRFFIAENGDVNKI